MLGIWGKCVKEQKSIFALLVSITLMLMRCASHMQSVIDRILYIVYLHSTLSIKVFI